LVAGGGRVAVALAVPGKVEVFFGRLATWAQEEAPGAGGAEEAAGGGRDGPGVDPGALGGGGGGGTLARAAPTIPSAVVRRVDSWRRAPSAARRASRSVCRSSSRWANFMV
jgi:hypothetical protein